MSQPARKGMKFGLAFDYLDPDLPLTENFDMLIRLTVAAEAAGFHLIYHPQHFMESQYARFQPLPVLARLAAETDRMVIVCADILPLNNPIRVAETIATLDVITGGRAILLGVLGYQTSEFAAFSVPMSERAGRTRATYELVARLLSGEDVTYRDEYFVLEDQSLGGHLRPVSSPRPAIWMTGHNDAGVRRAATHGDAWLISHQPRFGELGPQIEMYLEGRAARAQHAFHGFESHGIDLPMMREAFVGPSEDEAYDLAAAPMMESVAEYLQSDQLSALKDPASYQLPFEEWRVDRALIGDPQSVADELARYHETLGIDCVILKLHRKGIPFDRVLEAIRLTGLHVLPRFSGGSDVPAR